MALPAVRPQPYGARGFSLSLWVRTPALPEGAEQAEEDGKAIKAERKSRRAEEEEGGADPSIETLLSLKSNNLGSSGERFVLSLQRTAAESILARESGPASASASSLCRAVRGRPGWKGLGGACALQMHVPGLSQ